jgi:hypothetical protein
MKWKNDQEWWVGKDIERDGLGRFKLLLQRFPRQIENTLQFVISIMGIPANILGWLFPEIYSVANYTFLIIQRIILVNFVEFYKIIIITAIQLNYLFIYVLTQQP